MLSMPHVCSIWLLIGLVASCEKHRALSAGKIGRFLPP